jgi:protein gp37
MENSSIEWTDHTFNGWIGCTKVSPGCDHCYAEHRMDHRFGEVSWGAGQPRKRTGEANWNKPRAWNRRAAAFQREHSRRQRVFSASLSDWLDNEVPILWQVDLLDLVRETPDLDWLLLTKRIGTLGTRLQQVVDYLVEDAQPARPQLLRWVSQWLHGTPPPNVWLGASIVNQEEADRDIPKLLRQPALVHFVSMEPLLGPVDLRTALWECCGEPDVGAEYMGAVERICCGKPEPRDELDWVIVGGESGPEARPMHPEWARSLRDQCAAAGVRFFMKQMTKKAEVPVELLVREFPHALL